MLPMRVLIIQFLPSFADFLEHFGELLTLVVGEGAKGLLSKANAGAWSMRAFPGRFRSGEW